MVKQIFTPLVLLSSLAFMLGSCTKDRTISNSNDILGEWTVTGISSDVPYDWNGDGYRETDIYGTYSNCQRDIVLAFDGGGNGQSRQGCNASWQNLYWQLTNNNSTLNIQLSGDDLNLNLLQFTQNTIRGEDNIYKDGRNFVITYTLLRR